MIGGAEQGGHTFCRPAARESQTGHIWRSFGMDYGMNLADDMSFYGTIDNAVSMSLTA